MKNILIIVLCVIAGSACINAQPARPTRVVKAYAELEAGSIEKIGMDYLQALQKQDFDLAKSLSSEYEYNYHQKWARKHQNADESLARLLFDKISINLEYSKIEEDRADLRFRLARKDDTVAFGAPCSLNFLRRGNTWVVVHIAEWDEKKIFSASRYAGLLDAQQQ